MVGFRGVGSDLAEKSSKSCVAAGGYIVFAGFAGKCMPAIG
jgi:hypothetical protein